MLETLVTGFVVAFVLIAALGHVLLLQAVRPTRKTNVTSAAKSRYAGHAATSA
jgi:hypothetical protein